MESADIVFTNAAINILTKDVIILILEKMEPNDILNLCEVHAKFTKICNDKFVFIRLMQKLYPQFDVTDTPREQFEAITNGVTTKYLYNLRTAIVNIQALPNLKCNATLMNGKECYNRATPGAKKCRMHTVSSFVYFEIKGLQPKDGSEYWLRFSPKKKIGTVFRTEKDALNDPVVISDDGKDVVLKIIINNEFCE